MFLTSSMIKAKTPFSAKNLEEARHLKLVMPFWQRLLLTIVVMLMTSYLAGLLWQKGMGFPLPSYAAGAIGGLAALPVWDFLKRIRPTPSQ